MVDDEIVLAFIRLWGCTLTGDDKRPIAEPSRSQFVLVHGLHRKVTILTVSLAFLQPRYCWRNRPLRIDICLRDSNSSIPVCPRRGPLLGFLALPERCAQKEIGTSVTSLILGRPPLSLFLIPKSRKNALMERKLYLVPP